MHAQATKISLLVLLISNTLAFSQTMTPPPGGGSYFGSQGDSFDANTMKPPPIIPAQGPGVLTPIPSAPPPNVFPPESSLIPAPPPPKIWSGGAELGLNGATGNSEIFNLRVGFNARRKTNTNIFDTDFVYNFAQQEGLVTQQQALFNARDEILIQGTKWSYFGSTNIEYDELRAFDFRVGVYAGLGYVVIDDDTQNWRLRAGAGIVREIGGPADRWVAEGVLGTDYSLTIDDRQSLVSSLDYYPRIDDFTQFRIRARLAYQILLDKDTGTTLRFGFQDRYDSDPGPAKRNDFTYYTTLGFTY